MSGPFGEDTTVGPTEYGGDYGLVQMGDHEPTPAELIGMAVRADPMDPDAIDPATGLSAI